MKTTTALILVTLALCCDSVRAGFNIETKLTASDATLDDRFGYSVGTSGNMAIVGAIADAHAGTESGSAYLFDVPSGNQLFKLTASDAAEDDHFGWSVAISGNTAIVGGYRDDGVGTDSGAAYLFDATTGNQLFKLTATDIAPGDRFGYSVGISGNTAIVGSIGDDDAGGSSGSAYLFDVSTGTQIGKLTASDAAGGDFFGRSVGISGNVAIVGAEGNDDAGGSSGSAYLFDVSTGNQLFKLTANDAAANDLFGASVGISGNKAIVGAQWNDDGGNDSGSAYLFDVTTGNQLFKLTASDAALNDFFGTSVGISGGTAIVGAHGNDDNGIFSGSAYLFDVTNGMQISKLTASDAAMGDNFGRAVAIGGSSAIVGAQYDDNVGIDSGSAYVFTPEPNSLVLCGLTLLFAATRRTM